MVLIQELVRKYFKIHLRIKTHHNFLLVILLLAVFDLLLFTGNRIVCIFIFSRCRYLVNHLGLLLYTGVLNDVIHFILRQTGNKNDLAWTSDGNESFQFVVSGGRFRISFLKLKHACFSGIDVYICNTNDNGPFFLFQETRFACERLYPNTSSIIRYWSAGIIRKKSAGRENSG